MGSGFLIAEVEIDSKTRDCARNWEYAQRVGKIQYQFSTCFTLVLKHSITYVGASSL